MYKLEFLSIAKQDMNNIIYYISNKLNNKQAALSLAEEFIESANNILKFLYGVPEYLPVKKLKYIYRKIKIKNFYMFYTINEDSKTITIMRVIYYKRDMNNILN